MQSADKAEPIIASHIITFVDPQDMRYFLSKTKIELIDVIRSHPASVTH